ncbi:MAG: hypothetical protein LBN11_05105 [Tannerella sp.]|jgi:hypothetical protein|nr:hypothetical protein [Tannerella sp.]
MNSKFKLVAKSDKFQYEREFASIKSLRQFENRNKSDAVQMTAYIHHNGEWERFAIIGNQVVPKSELQTLINQLQ